MRTIPEGIKSKVYHQRHIVGERDTGKYVKGEKLLKPIYATKGGKTVVELLNDEDQVVCVGVAVCNEKDNYNKKIGRMIATGRAVKLLGA